MANFCKRNRRVEQRSVPIHEVNPSSKNIQFPLPQYLNQDIRIHQYIAHLEILRRRSSFRSPRMYSSVSGRSVLSFQSPTKERSASFRLAASSRYFSRRALRTNSETVERDCRARMWSVFHRSSSRYSWVRLMMYSIHRAAQQNVPHQWRNAG